MTDDEANALAARAFEAVGDLLLDEGLKPEDRVSGRIFATMLAGHYLARGGTSARDETVLLLLSALDAADNLIAAGAGRPN